MTNPFDQIPKSMLSILAGMCECKDDRRSCPKCAITMEVNRVIEAGMSPEKWFYVLVRLVAETIGQSAGGEAKHRGLIQTFTSLLRVTVAVVEGERVAEHD